MNAIFLRLSLRSLFLFLFAGFAFGCKNDTTGQEVLPPQTDSRPALLFSEIMYHPVLENDYVDRHEFVELFNRGTEDLDVSGWQISGDIRYVFPAGTKIAKGTYVVVAKDKAALVMVQSYKLSIEQLYGNYEGELDNRSSTLQLIDSSNNKVDSVTYTDGFPYPIGADALGADDEWLAQLPRPLTSAPHQYMGISLQRVSFDLDGAEIANWVPSPVDGATPGKDNGISGLPPTIVLRKTVSPPNGNLLISSQDSVKMSFVFSNHIPLSKPQLEWFVDDVQKTGEPVTTVDLTNNNGFYETTIPPKPNNSIIRFRILVDKGNGSEVISPRPSDPLTHWAYFVTPTAPSGSPIYSMFIKKDNWNKMYDNAWPSIRPPAPRCPTTTTYPTANDKRVKPGCIDADRCEIRQEWDQQVPAVLVKDGVVYDVMARYAGSRWNRTNGIPFDPTKTSIAPTPDRPTNTVLSWKIDFPNYARFEGNRSKVMLNKLNQACPGLDEVVGQLMYGDPSINIPTQDAHFVRFHVNGGYYHYMLDLESIDGEMLKRFVAKGERVGDLFKADGNAGAVEGPWGPSDESTLLSSATCTGYSVDDRYKYTYDRKTYNWDNHSKLRKTIEAVNTLRATAVSTGDYSALKAFLIANYDVQKMIDYIVIRNWAVPWDEGFHNHFLYQNISDGKWFMIPQDKDREWGEAISWYNPFTKTTEAFLGGRSFYWGEEGNGQYNRWKDAFIKCFRNEIRQRIIDLDQAGILNPAIWQSKVQQAAATFNQTDYLLSPAVSSACNFDTELQGLMAFGGRRHLDVLDLQEETSCTAATCGLKADMYQTATGDTTRDFAKAILKASKTVQTVNSDFGTGSPDPAVLADSFQIRYTGRVVPRFGETYTFFVQSDEGVRLWVNNVLIIDNWVTQTATEKYGNITLTANTPVSIRLEYFENTGTASVRLRWYSPSQYYQVIPTNRLKPT